MIKVKRLQIWFLNYFSKASVYLTKTINSLLVIPLVLTFLHYSVNIFKLLKEVIMVASKPTIVTINKE
jgi:hypothetical protein